MSIATVARVSSSGATRAVAYSTPYRSTASCTAARTPDRARSTPASCLEDGGPEAAGGNLREPRCQVGHLQPFRADAKGGQRVVGVANVVVAGMAHEERTRAGEQRAPGLGAQPGPRRHRVGGPPRVDRVGAVPGANHPRVIGRARPPVSRAVGVEQPDPMPAASQLQRRPRAKHAGAEAVTCEVRVVGVRKCDVRAKCEVRAKCGVRCVCEVRSAKCAKCEFVRTCGVRASVSVQARGAGCETTSRSPRRRTAGLRTSRRLRLALRTHASDFGLRTPTSDSALRTSHPNFARRTPHFALSNHFIRERISPSRRISSPYFAQSPAFCAASARS